MTDVAIKTFDSKSELIEAATAFLSDLLDQALEARGEASLMLSGGSSPKPIYEALADCDLKWDGVFVSLIDERWVPSGAAGSNADFIQACFDGRKAQRAHFTPLYNGHDRASDGLIAAEQALSLLPQPFDICVMGMGVDAHTASWFSNSAGLAESLDPDNAATVCAVDATGCHVAGDHTDRITLTYSAVAASRHVVLLLQSAEKTTIFREAIDKAVTDAPVKALYDLGDTLTVFALETD